MAIRTLIAKFIADTTQFEAGVKKATKALTPFQEQMKAIRGIGGSLRLLMGGAAFAGIAVAANKIAGALRTVNEELLAVATNSKTAWEAFTSSLNAGVAAIPIIGGIATELGNLFRYDVRRDIGKNTAMEQQADAASQLNNERVENKNRLKETMSAGRERLQVMVNLGREQADERSRELASLHADGRERLNAMIGMGFQQRDDGARQRMEDLTDMYHKLRMSAKEQLESSLSEVQSIVGRFVDPMTKLQEEINKVTMAWEQGRISGGDYMSTVNALQKEIEKLGAAKTESVTSPDFGRDFRQGRLAGTVGIGGLQSASSSNGQRVTDPQLKETNRLLAAIERNSGRGSATYAP